MTGLTELVAHGFTAVAFIRNDPILGSMAGNEAFDKLTDDLDSLAYPCENDPALSEFDFWIGEWDVHTVADNKTNPIRGALDALAGRASKAIF
jgi:hypothetical protein